MEETDQQQLVRIRDVIEGFIDTATAERTLTGESVGKYRAAILAFVKAMGNLALQEMTAETFVGLKRHLTMSGAGPSHINGIIYAVKRLIHDCQHRLRIPVADLTMVKPLPVPRRTVTYLTADECEQFFSVIRVDRRNGEPNLHALSFRTLVEVLAGTGMRVSEALALNLSTIRWRGMSH